MYCITITHPDQRRVPVAAVAKKISRALVAQLDRVLASEAKGRGFDSRRARHFSACDAIIKQEDFQGKLIESYLLWAKKYPPDKQVGKISQNLEEEGVLT